SGRHQPGAPMSRAASTTSATDETMKPSRGSTATYSTSAMESTTGNEDVRVGGSIGRAGAPAFFVAGSPRPAFAVGGLFKMAVAPLRPLNTKSHTATASSAIPAMTGTIPGPGVASVSSG